MAARVNASGPLAAQIRELQDWAADGGADFGNFTEECKRVASLAYQEFSARPTEDNPAFALLHVDFNDDQGGRKATLLTACQFTSVKNAVAGAAWKYLTEGGQFETAPNYGEQAIDALKNGSTIQVWNNSAVEERVINDEDVCDITALALADLLGQVWTRCYPPRKNEENGPTPPAQQEPPAEANQSWETLRNTGLKFIGAVALAVLVKNYLNQ